MVLEKKNLVLVDIAAGNGTNGPWNKVILHDPETMENFELFSSRDEPFHNAGVNKRGKCHATLSVTPSGKGFRMNITKIAPAS